MPKHESKIHRIQASHRRATRRDSRSTCSRPRVRHSEAPTIWPQRHFTPRRSQSRPSRSHCRRQLSPSHAQPLASLARSRRARAGRCGDCGIAVHRRDAAARWQWSLTGNAGRSGREVSPQLRPLVPRGIEAALGVHFAAAVHARFHPAGSVVHSGGARGRPARHRPALRHLRPETGPFGRIHVVVARRDCAIGRLLASARDGGQLCETSAVPGADRGRVVPSRPLDPQLRPARGRHAAEWMEPLALGGEVLLLPTRNGASVVLPRGSQTPRETQRRCRWCSASRPPRDRRSCDR